MAILKAQKTDIVDGNTKVALRGINLGGWLMPEAYFMCAPNRPYRSFKADFIKTLGTAQFADLEKAFRDNFIMEKDIARIRALGFNCLRVPFHYGLVETKPFKYSREGVGYLDRVIQWAAKNRIWVILDMHAVPGSQNHDWHSDSDGRMLFWSSKTSQRRAIALWEFLADRYKDEPAVAGYDLLNEAVIEDAKPLNRYYQALIKAIRQADRNHIFFVEGNRWAQNIECLDDFTDDNLALSFHFYEPLEFTCNFVPQLRYPLVSKAGRWDSSVMRKRLETLKSVADKRGRALLCGEFGVNTREGIYGEDRWLADILKHFRSLDIHWTYWTWKAMRNHMFQDGIYSYYPNDPWVNRQGPEYGWETWKRHWPARKKEMTVSWRTEAFGFNKKTAEVFHEAL